MLVRNPKLALLLIQYKRFGFAQLRQLGQQGAFAEIERFAKLESYQQVIKGEKEERKKKRKNKKGGGGPLIYSIQCAFLCRCCIHFYYITIFRQSFNPK
jgi:hypothetical protein